MKNINATLATFLAVFLYATAHCQDSIPEFGKVDMADMRLKECPFDKGAAAMNLFNYESATAYPTENGPFIDVERRVRIKIFNQAGFKYAAVEIPYAAGDQDKIKNISAITYNLDEQGNIVTQKLDKKDLFKESVNKDEKTVRFAFSSVKAGSIIEFRYVEKSDFNVSLNVWAFDDYIPTRKSICKIGYKTFMSSNIGLAASMPVQQQSDTSYNDIKATYVMTDIPAFRHEAFMGPVKDNIQRLEFSILPSAISSGDGSAADKWLGISTFLFNSPFFGGQLKLEISSLKKELEGLKKLPVKDKIGAVYALVRKNIKWDGTYGLFAKNIQDAWAAKQGTSADINFITISCLRQAGVECYPIITSTNGNGKIDAGYGSINQFNCVDILVMDGGTAYVIDATQKFQPYTVPPFNVINNYGLVVDKKRGMLFNIQDNRPLMKNIISLKAIIDSNGMMTGTVSEYFYDYAKVDVLSNTGKRDDDKSKDLLQQDIVNFKADSVKDENADDDEKPLLRTFTFKLEMQQTGDYFFLNPLFLSNFRKNPFTDTARRANIDFGCNQLYSVDMYITFPGNFEVSEIPANKEIRLPDTSVSFRRFIAVQNNTLVVRNYFGLQNAIYTAAQYPFVKQVFEKIYGLLNEQIVLKRKQ